MNDQIPEQLSALMDGELEKDSSRFLFKRMEHDEELAATWQRYHLVREVLRDSRGRFASPGFADSLAERIAAEPAPAQSPQVRGWLRTVAGFAIAASVAIVAVAVSRPDVGGTLNPSAPPAGGQLAETISVPTLQREISAQPASAAARVPRLNLQDPRVQRYLETHGQSAGGQAVLPYLVLVERPAAVSTVSVPQTDRISAGDQEPKQQ
jgi:sigma-E factor negative regulatory protein RseA